MTTWGTSQLRTVEKGSVLPSRLVKRPKPAKSYYTYSDTSILVRAQNARQSQGTLDRAPNQTIPPDIPMPSHSPTPINDLGDPIAILNARGITEGNMTDISALATALESFGDFKRGTSWNIGKEGATQLIAITKLLQEASLLHGPGRLATNNDLQKAVSNFKDVVTSCQNHPITLNNIFYATAARCGLGAPSNQGRLQKQKMTAELQQKQIFISMKNVPIDTPMLKWESAILTRYCSNVITNFFEKDLDSAPMPLLLHGITKSVASNVTLTFKTFEDMNKARAHTNKIIDSTSTTPQWSYIVVAHNASTNTWSDTEDLKDAIDGIEAYNSDNALDGCQIANLVWLNSE